MTTTSVSSFEVLYAGDDRAATIDEMWDRAHARLDAATWDFLEGGAGHEVTLRGNRSAFDRIQLRTRVLSGIGHPDTSTTFLGIPLSYPVLTAPFGCDRLFHPEGHRAVARANESFGVASIVPEFGSFPFEDIRAAAPAAAAICQIHPVGSHANFARMLRRAEDAGFSAVCLTVDCPTPGWRERNMRNRFDPDPEVVSGNYPPEAGGPGVLFEPMMDPGEHIWTWEEVADACSEVSLPFMAKGILTAEDARAAADAGAAAVLVSNHGGRQLDGAPPSIEQLPEIAAEVGGEIGIVLDSGIRTGGDIIKALALGADAVVIGRTAAMGLTADGEAGVGRVHELLHDELVNLMRLCGRPDIASLDATLVKVPAGGR